MSTVTVPNRPFASDRLTGFMLPDGIFVTMFGRQYINAQFMNAGAAAMSGATAYLESASHPTIGIAPGTQSLGTLSSGAVRTLSWEADFTNCPAGTHLLSFVIERGTVRERVIKKIFVTRVTFDEPSKTFRAEVPEGTLEVRFSDFLGPRHTCCGGKRRKRHDANQPREGRQPSRHRAPLGFGLRSFTEHQSDFRFCPPGYLPTKFETVWIPNPAYTGQFSDLPFEDPWWKVVLCILAVVLLLAAAYEAATSGDGEIIVTVGGGGGAGGMEDPCACEAEGGSSSYVVAGLVAAAAASATIAAMSDDRDTMRRGQDHTPPPAGELTIREKLTGVMRYREAIALGRPFSVGVKWDYERQTTTGVFSHGATDVRQNVHVLSKYEIDAPDVHPTYHRKGPWIIRARFFDKDGKIVTGDRLLVQCFLVGPSGQWHKFTLQDDGNWPDREPLDGWYSGAFVLTAHDIGLWRYFVIAQDVNRAQPDMTPEDAAKIIGGTVLTHQLSIVFDQDDCPLVPDGHVNVV